MENCLPAGSAAVPDASHQAVNQRDAGSTRVTAHNGSVVNTPNFTGIHATRDANLTVTVNNTYVQSSARTDETNAAAPNLQGNIQECRDELKEYLQNKTKDLFQGTKESGSSTLLSLKASGLEELHLSRNTLQDSGMELLSDGLKSPNCQLQKLSLRDCKITREGCRSLARALVSNPSHLRELDLSQNKIHLVDQPHSEPITPPLKEHLNPVQPSEMNPHKKNIYNNALKVYRYIDDDQELDPLSEVLSKCSLETLRLCECGIPEKPLKRLASALSSNPSHLKNLDLSKTSFGSQSFSLLLDFLKHPDCQLQTLCLFKANLKTECAAALASALNLSHLTELDLGGNDLGDAGMIEFAALLEDPNCKVATLRLAGCRVTESGCAALASSLKSNPAHLRVLDLARNNFKDTGVENLSDYLAEPLCQLKVLNLQCCTLTAACCRCLSLALGCCSALKELDLSYNTLMDQGVKLLCDWLRKPQCKLEILRLSWCTESSSTGSEPAGSLWCFLCQDSWVKECRMETSITNGQAMVPHKSQYAVTQKDAGNLTVAAQSGGVVNTPQLIGVRVKGDLTINTCVQSPAKREALSPKNKDEALGRLVPVFKLSKKALLSDCNLTDRCCECISSVLHLRSSVLEELDLSRNELQDSGMRLLSDGLKDPNCKLQRLG
ncbi:hypothetical protein Q5P01_025754 [Channa striata]|uniref:Uncharacterized protein n=1 Tax=Channa striata TaxID=64152 RepID=A0AA88IXE4_CHASR|nr:hypothetical protein Q5P01_025754 [Channa striata]